MRDKKQIVKVLLLVVMLYVSWVLGKSLWDLYQARGRLTEAEMRLEEARSENQELKKKWEEVNSDEFKEREVRDKLSRQLPGETVVIVPEIDVSSRDRGEGEVMEMVNWEKWRELFFGED